MKCESCGYNNKGVFVCEVCGFVMSENVVKKKLGIKKVSDKNIYKTSEGERVTKEEAALS